LGKGERKKVIWFEDAGRRRKEKKNDGIRKDSTLYVRKGGGQRGALVY